MNYYFEGFKKYAVFDGRARRKEYWMFVLFTFLILFVLMFITQSDNSQTVVNIYRLVVIIPFIAFGIRRMHDVNKSGWYILFPLYNLILACTDGTMGDNEYGTDPREMKKIKDTLETSERNNFQPQKEPNIAKETSSSNANIKYCSHCGVKYAKDVRFCSSCGKSFM